MQTSTGSGGEELYNLDATLEIRFLISSRHAGGIIGKSGSYINKIRDTAEVDFHVHRPVSENVPVYTDGSRATQNYPVRTGSCRGQVRNVTSALLMMADKVTELTQNHIRRRTNNGSLFPHGDYHLTLLLEHKNCGVVIGKRGSRINENRERSGAHIKISTHTLANSSEKTVDLQGSRESVSHALETLISQIANDPKPSSTQRRYMDDSEGGKTNGMILTGHSSFRNHQQSPNASLMLYPSATLVPHPPFNYHHSNQAASYVIPPTHLYPANMNRINVAGSSTPTVADVKNLMNVAALDARGHVTPHKTGEDSLGESDVQNVPDLNFDALGLFIRSPSEDGLSPLV